MKYRVRIDAVFDTEADARAIFAKAMTLKAKAKAISTEPAFITLERCGHDESPPRPCVTIETLELSP